jgi:hypothetical protein
MEEIILTCKIFLIVPLFHIDLSNGLKPIGFYSMEGNNIEQAS